MSEGADNRDTPADGMDPHAASDATASPDASATEQLPDVDDNPFDEMPTRESVPGDDAETRAEGQSAESGTQRVHLPDCFTSIGAQLPPNIRAKLKECDLSVARVTLAREFGEPTEETTFAFLCSGDFARNAARRLGGGGFIQVSVVEKGKEPWGFAFEYTPAEAEKPDQNQQMAAMLRQFAGAINKRFEDLEMRTALGGSGGGKSDALELLKELKAAGLIGQPPQSSGAGFAEMAKAFAEFMGVSNQMQVQSIENMLRSRDFADKLGGGKAPDKTTAQELKEIFEIEPVKKITDATIEAGVKRLTSSRNDQSAPANTGRLADVDDNPFEEAV